MPPRPIAIGSPATLFWTSAAIAPASCAFRILTEKRQPPREIRAILPVRLPAGRAEHAVLRPLVVPATFASVAVRSEVTVAKSPDAAGTVRPPAVTGVAMKCPTVAAPAVRARSALPGDSIVFRPGPLLPA